METRDCCAPSIPSRDAVTSLSSELDFTATAIAPSYKVLVDGPTPSVYPPVIHQPRRDVIDNMEYATRDGVSDGQFAAVLYTKVGAIRPFSASSDSDRCSTLSSRCCTYIEVSGFCHVKMASAEASAGEPPEKKHRADVQAPGERPEAPSLELARRKGFGGKGSGIRLLANLYKVHLSNISLVEYEVTIVPKDETAKAERDLPRALNRAIFDKWRELYAQDLPGLQMCTYDGGKAAYAVGGQGADVSARDARTWLVDLPRESGKARAFDVTLAQKTELKIEELMAALQNRTGRAADFPQHTIQGLDVVMQESLAHSRSVIGRSFFNLACPPQARRSLGEGLVMYPGHYQSLRAIQADGGRLALNLDVAHAAFLEEGPLIEYVSKVVGRKLNPGDQERLTPTEFDRANKALKRVKVTTDHMRAKRGYLVLRLGEESAEDFRRVRNTSFAIKPRGEPSETDAAPVTKSVAQYFQETYNVTLQYPRLQCAVVRNNGRLPLEVCHVVPGQLCTRLNERQTGGMIRQANRKPSERVNDTDKLKYENLTVTSKDGAWNLRNTRFLKGASVTSWALINLSKEVSQQEARRFVGDLIGGCKAVGVMLDDPVSVDRGNPNDVSGTLGPWLARMGRAPLQMVVVILDPGVKPVYGELKTYCEVARGLISQCCCSQKVRERDQRKKLQYIANLALKINVKTGGQNAAFLRPHPRLKEKRTLIAGADVSHPGARDDVPSVAAVVGSLDGPTPSVYRPVISIQEPRREIIDNMESATKDLLDSFYKSIKAPPDRVLMFRDGVSEGQFGAVLNTEVEAMKRAIRTFGAEHQHPEYDPRMAFIIIQKKHHMRIFSLDAAGRPNNPEPGTVVDRDICSPYMNDFFLNSHKGLLASNGSRTGTNRPAHYFVLYDEIGYSADDIQEMANDLCYVYAKCTRSISVVPPAYYADKVATRGRMYIEAAAGSESGSSGGRDTWRDVKLPEVQDVIRNRMFYC
ncbi:hypothetical protein KFL_000640170 [Klebsormidium nitens]|uniref:Argonaute family protein n=1 Tax=Klebsormidium nitens TaxID=105231 RepID=A0A1Y1HQF1_KLENI|nr:hypothetical protein KFL_000640170 [Klebsormidium nitens]|eukprot:GAQ80850.1 hypothetical protein KFL_000640170 [Klebsormidium nitens]